MFIKDLLRKRIKRSIAVEKPNKTKPKKKTVSFYLILL